MAPGRPLRVAVLGPGGVGGLLAVLLAGGGSDVLCLAPPATAAHLDRAGLRLVSARFGDRTAAVRGATALTGAVDVCLVTTKATQLAAALDRVPADVLGGALLVPLLNGLEHVDLLRARYPDARTVAGSIRVSAARTAPGVVEHSGSLAEVALGPDAEVLAGALRPTGIDVVVRPGERALLWAKLVFLAPLALTTTALGAPIGAVRERRPDQLAAVVAEVAAVAGADGAGTDPEATLGALRALPADTRSSMERDAAAGNPTELEAIGGAVLRVAERRGVAVPETARVVADLRARLGG
ncbi:MULTISPECIES: ketopantoate reductase family protein [unclassified Blastococcus]